jgi:hypothetical protein
MASMLETRILTRDDLRKADDLDGLTPQQADWLVERTAQARHRGPVRQLLHAGVEWISLRLRREARLPRPR